MTSRRPVRAVFLCPETACLAGKDHIAQRLNVSGHKATVQILTNCRERRLKKRNRDNNCM